MAPKALVLSQHLQRLVSAELAPAVMAPTVTEIANEGLDTLFPCCVRLQIPVALREAVATRIGAPRGDFSIYQLQQLTQDERN